ncbi:MAG: hypothetical protein CMO74_05860 [Verrucomicrobiales bacterium]|nr:hypothetical protein [Verrucomicrobiales bacterium]|tara:strand:+ start:38140 stop:38880 length:741 start_codon:yes stop_codon:yes gene_type:complete
MAEEEAQVPEENAAGGDAAAGADAAAEASAEAKPRKSGGFLLPLILMPVLCAGAAYGVGFMLLKKVDTVLAGIKSGAVLAENASGDAAAEGGAGGDAKGDDHGGDDGHGGDDDGHGGEGDAAAVPGEVDDPEELVPIVDPEDPAATRAVVVNPKGTQGKRYIVVEVYLQRSEPKDTDFKTRVSKKTKLLQEIVTRELEAHTIEDLQKPVTKDYIRRTLQKKFNNDLEGAGYSTPVGKVVFSKWVMQ